MLELEAELALAREDDPDAALDAYRRWSEADPDDPEPWIGSAEVYLDYGEAGEAARLLRELLADFELDPLDEADARHLLGLACEEKGDRKGMVKEWLAVLRLDAANDDPEPLMSPGAFEKVAAAALDELPAEILAHLRNVPIFVEDRPSEALVLEGLDPRTLGLFHGIAMPDQSVLGRRPGDRAHPPLPAQPRARGARTRTTSPSRSASPSCTRRRTTSAPTRTTCSASASTETRRGGAAGSRRPPRRRLAVAVRRRYSTVTIVM